MVVSTKFNHFIALHEQCTILCRMPGCSFHAENVHTGPQPSPIEFPLMSKSLSPWDKMGYLSQSTQHVEENSVSVSSTRAYPINGRRRKFTLDTRAGPYKDWSYVCHQNLQRTPVVKTRAHKIKSDNNRRLQYIRNTRERISFPAALIRCWETMGA